MLTLYRQLSQLDQGLLAFQTAARQFGLLASASELRIRLHSVEALFHENAACIFPGIKSKIIDIDHDKPKSKKPKMANRRRSDDKTLVLHPVLTIARDPETLPEELMGLAKNLKNFLMHLEQFPEFVDEALNASMTAFESDLRVRSFLLITDT
jgi:WD repeat-containing protein 26